MTVAQRAMVDHRAQFPRSTAFQSVLALLVAGRLDPGWLRRAADAVAGRHDLTRATFQGSGPGATCHVGTTSTWLVQCEDIPELEEHELARLPRTFLEVPIDLGRGGLRLHVVTGREWTLLAIVGHVAVVDAQSNALLVCELLDAYAADDTAGHTGHATAVKAWHTEVPGWTFGDVARAESAYLATTPARALLEARRRHLSGAVAAELPLDRPRPVHAGMRGQTVRATLSAEEVAALRTAAAAASVTLFSLLLGAFTWLLHEATGEDDLVFGLMMTSRSSSRTRQTVGNLANLVPFRATVAPSASVHDLAIHCAQGVPEALRCVSIPYWTLVGDLAAGGAGPLPPHCRVKFNALGAPVGEPLLESVLRGDGSAVDYRGLRVKGLDVPQSEGQLDLAAHIVHGRDFLHVDFRFDVEILDEATVAAHLDRFVEILRHAANATETPSAPSPTETTI